MVWQPDFELPGATVTKRGLEAVWMSVRFLTRA